MSEQQVIDAPTEPFTIYQTFKPSSELHKFPTESILKALEDTHGGVYLAAQRLGCSKDTIYDRSRVVPAIRELIANRGQVLLDDAERLVATETAAGNLTAAMFILKMRGHSRGWKSISQVDSKTETTTTSLETKIDLTKLSAEELRAFVALMTKVRPVEPQQLPDKEIE